MTTNVVTIDPEATVAEALERIRGAGLRCLIVEKRAAGDSYAILTQRDLVYKVMAEGRDLEQTRVHEIMTRPLVAVHEEMNLQDVARLMRLTGLSRLPVIYRGAVQGIVSVTDLLATL